MKEMPPADVKGRWPRRRVLAHLVSALAYSVPVGAAIGASLGLSGMLPRPGGAWVDAADWIVIVAVSSLVLVLVDRLTRRLLPLAALLELSLRFPDHAPDRLSVALRAGSIRNLHARIEEAKRNGVADEPSRAAVRIVELVGALHAHDRRTRGHSERVRALTDVLAEELKLGPEDRDRLRWSALLHDIGKVHVPSRVLNKPGQLQPDEWEVVRRHPEEGARLAAPLEPWLGEWAQVIVQHHERWDGSGYPRGLTGTDISYGARIVALADAYEVMTASRSYKAPMSVAAARRELTQLAGAQFDPLVVRAFLEVSLGRLRWIAGPMSWAAQLPALGWLRQTVYRITAPAGQALGQAVGRAAGVVATAAGAAGVAVVAGALGVPAPAPAASAATFPPATAASAAGDPSANGVVTSAVGPAAPAPSAETAGSVAAESVSPADPVVTPPASDPPDPTSSAPASPSGGASSTAAPVVSAPENGVAASATGAHPGFPVPVRRRVGWARKLALGEPPNSGQALSIVGSLGFGG